jgi:Tripartite tricarboxylate transporter family receptor
MARRVLEPFDDVTVYLVLNDHGKNGIAYDETDPAQADRETIIRNFLSGQYSNALRVVAFNTAEGWSRDVSEDIAGEVLEQAFDADDNLGEDTKRFIDRHVTPGQKRPPAPSLRRATGVQAQYGVGGERKYLSYLRGAIQDDDRSQHASCPVPYRGSGPALTDLLGGQVEVMFDNMGSSVEHVRAGRLRALGVTAATRLKVLPDIPPVGDFVAGYEATSVGGFGLPRGTPGNIVDKLSSEINAGLADPKVKARIAELGVSVVGGSPGEFGEIIAYETEKWGKVVKFAGIKAD